LRLHALRVGALPILNPLAEKTVLLSFSGGDIMSKAESGGRAP